jgi:hypothetical protein
MLENPYARRRVAIALTLGLTSLALPATAADVLSGEWVGSYTCYQGLTALTLTIEPAGEQWSGIFTFGPNKDNKTVPHGSYELVITPSADGFHMEPGAWIVQPEGYAAVALDGDVSEDLTMLAGNVQFDGCTRFATARTTPLPALSAPKTK